MRLDHVSYAVSNKDLSSTVQRIGSLLNTAFEDGGIHPEFGTRNFICPLLNGQYIEIVCPLEHPATELTPFGKAVKQKALQGGGWLSWVMAVEDLKHIEEKLGRHAVKGHRIKPDKTELTWLQIGVLNLLKYPQLPFFIKWISGTHPSASQKSNSAIKQINLIGQRNILEEEMKFNLDLVPQINLLEVSDIERLEDTGIESIVFKVGSRLIEIE
jgi:hypothetical protein